MPFIYAICMLLSGIFIVSIAILLVASLGIFALATFKKWRATQIIAAVTFAGALMTGGIFTYLFILDPAPEGVFATAFERPVPKEVTNMRCHKLWIGDCFITWLRFETSEEEFRKLVSADLLRNPENPRIFAKETGGPNAPDWWKPGAQENSICYSVLRGPGKVHPGEKIFLVYCPDEHAVYYYFVGWS